LDPFELLDDCFFFLLALAPIQYLVFVLQHHSVYLLQQLGDRRSALDFGLHSPFVDLQQLLVPAVEVVDELVHSHQLLVDLHHLGLGGKVRLFLGLPFLDALVQLNSQLLDPYVLLVDDVVPFVDLVLLVPDHLVELLDDPVGALDLPDGLQLLELVLVLDHLVLLLHLGYRDLHVVLLVLALFLPPQLLQP
jgi:hypothetical protein